MANNNYVALLAYGEHCTIMWDGYNSMLYVWYRTLCAANRFD